MMEMTWLLMWLNVSATTLNSTLQLLVLYRLYYLHYLIIFLGSQCYLNFVSMNLRHPDYRKEKKKKRRCKTCVECTSEI